MNSSFKIRQLIRYYKDLILISLTLLFLNCSSVKMTGSWRNESYQKYIPEKILIIGVTPNLTAQMIFEDKLANEFRLRGILASTSTLIFPERFIENKQSELQIQEEIDNLLDQEFDAILVTAVRGVDERQAYSEGYAKTDYYWRRFKGYYFVYQDIYYNPGYYEKYNVYHIESSLFHLNPLSGESSLVWVANFDMVDPQDLGSSVNDYVENMVKALEKEGILVSKGN
ncbi:hypothetical protein SAMN04487906_2850 [Zhouia amylolytica]|uniref:Uncharacterized protein n=1 Tax=Zhouia amylolytica TaxID=376730 RepID=A0A1I6V425_9FLAO|nr:hypothetical protein [Zhouia amylolytica]SFT08453.1 hypothetical protein SAMN04487906_2850 [Zhouia amylolytica]